MTGPIGPSSDATASGSDAQAALSPDQRLQVVSDLARDVTARLDLGDVLGATLTGLRRLVPFGGGSIQLLDDDGWIRMAAADPPAPDEVFALRIPLGSTVGGRVILTERPVYLPDVLVEPGVSAEGGRPGVSGGVRSYFGVPLLVEGHAIGLLQLDHTVAGAWDEHDRLLLMCVAPIVAAAIQNARAHTRVATMTAARRRAAQQLEGLTETIDQDISRAVDALAAACADRPDAMAEIERLRAALSRVRTSLAEQADAGGAPPEPRSPVTTNLDLRTTDFTRSRR